MTKFFCLMAKTDDTMRSDEDSSGSPPEHALFSLDIQLYLKAGWNEYVRPFYFSRETFTPGEFTNWKTTIRVDAPC